jgi:DNA-binding transcriptional MerR regulator
VSSSYQVPTKLYYRIGEVAGIVGVEPHVLRYWETEFRSIRPEKSRKGQRVYSRRDVETLLKVRELLYGHRYTIAGAKRKLRGEGVEPLDQTDPAYRQIRNLRDGLEALRGDIVAALDGLEALRHGALRG